MVFAMFWVYKNALIGPVLELHGIGMHLTPTEFNLLALNTVLVALAGYWINDWRDRNIDSINRSNRFLVRRKYTSLQFYMAYSTIVAIGLVIAIYLALRLDYLKYVWMYPLFVFIFWYYAVKGKAQGFAGNIIVSAAIAFIPWLVVLAEKPSLRILFELNHDDLHNLMLHLILSSILMFLANLVREIVKDGEDFLGDSMHNSGSLLASFGLEKTKAVLLINVFLLAVIESYLVYITPWVSPLFYAVSILLAFAIIFSLMKIKNISKQKDYAILNFITKLTMILGMAQIAALQPS